MDNYSLIKIILLLNLKKNPVVEKNNEIEYFTDNLAVAHKNVQENLKYDQNLMKTEGYN